MIESARFLPDLPNRQKGVFVTGTDTSVGKTAASAALMHRYRGRLPVIYWKPVQTGIEQDDDTRTVRCLGQCTADEIFDRGIRLPRPLSPHLSARLSGSVVQIEALLECWRKIPESRRPIVEGAGGLLVPLNGAEMIADLISALNLDVVIVARSTLGTINHTLLTIEALAARSLRLAGIVMVGEPSFENRAAIERYGGARVLGEMPLMNPLTPDAIRSWALDNLDSAGVLMESLR